MTPSRLRSDQRGFSLVEVLVAALVLLVGIGGTVALIDGANARTVDTKGREAGTNLARELTEQVRSIPYGQLAPASLAPSLQEQPGLGDGNQGSGGWSIRRRGFSYEVDARVCSVDDPKDGLAADPGAGFCSVSTDPNCVANVSTGGTPGAQLCVSLGNTTIATLCGGPGGGGGGAGSLCPGSGSDDNPDDYKLALFSLRWGQGRRHVTQATVIPNPGSSNGPGIRTLVAAGLNQNVLQSPSPQVSFVVTTSRTPQSVQWSIDGHVKGSAQGAGQAWSFSWPVADLEDGAYLVGARAFDAGGQPGTARTVTITLNRFPPAAPTGFLGGRNGPVVDFEWRASTERDIVGYRVYEDRVTVADRLACSLTTRTDCIDDAPPDLPLVSYYVVALDRDTGGNLREGARSTVRAVTKTNNPPNAPTGLTASVSAGSTVLRWNAAVPRDPDAGDTVEDYRVYRDGRAYVDRYDRFSCTASTCTFTDTQTGDQQHSYWVTAVDQSLAESPLVGPVTR